MKRFWSLILVLCLLCSLAACTKQNADTTPEDPTPAPAEQPAGDPTPTEDEAQPQEPSVQLPTAEAPQTMPLCEDKLSYSMWIPATSLQNTGLDNYGQGKFFEWYENLTNVHIDWQMASATDFVTQWNLMIASRLLPDAMAAGDNSSYFKAGLDAFIEEDELIVPLEDYSKYYPNYNYWRSQQEDTMRRSVTDGGHVPGLYQLRVPAQPAWQGPVIRDDLLDDIGFDGTTADINTLADWENVLTLFRDSGKVAIPYWVPASTGLDHYLLASFGVYNGGMLYQLDGKVVFGAAQDGFKDYLALYRDWYATGLLDVDFTSRSGNDSASQMMGGNVGLGQTYKAFYDTLNLVTADGGHWVPLSAPVREEGQTFDAAFAYVSRAIWQGTITVISTSCDPAKIPVILQYWDYLYSEEGSFVANYGFEGETFVYDAEGKPVFKDFMNNGEDGYNFNQHLAQLCLFQAFSFRYQWLRTETNITDDARTLYQTWEKNFAEEIDELPSLSVPLDIVSDYSAAYNNITTYVGEFVLKVILNQIDLDAEWENYLKTMDDMRLPFVLETQQQVLDAFYERDVYIGY